MKRILAAMVLLLAAGCSSDVVADGPPVADPYDEPLDVRTFPPGDPMRAGAAKRALQCSGPHPAWGGAGGDSGAPGGHGSAEDALAAFLTERFGVLPATGYRVERDEGRRVLYSYDVRGKTKVAVIVADGLRDDEGRVGWWVETFAWCLPTEFPDSVSNWKGDQVWMDDEGTLVPTKILSSYPGAPHCNWENVTFLKLKGQFFVRNPVNLPLRYFRTTFERDASLPWNASDTGYRRDHRQLWLAADKSAAYIVTTGHVERWPAAIKEIFCL